jgi:hypothetical protein
MSHRRPAAAIAWLAALGLAAPSPTLACGFCFSLSGNPLALPHPRAIEIAVATRAALDRGLIRQRLPEPATGAGWDRRQERSGVPLMKAWVEGGHAAKAFSAREPFTLHIVLVDTSEGYAAHLRSGRAEFEPQPGSPADVVVVTTRPALCAILANQINLDDAVAAGVLVVERPRKLARGALCGLGSEGADARRGRSVGHGGRMRERKLRRVHRVPTRLGPCHPITPLEGIMADSSARGPWARPVARWTPALGEQNRARVEAAYAELVRKYGPERADLIGRVDRNVLIFPNLIILDLMGVVVRKITPTSAGHTKITQWSLATAGEDGDMRARRLANCIAFQGPGGFATPDNLKALEACQAGYRTGAGVPWSDLSRGMHREHSGQSCCSSDERQMRAFWRQWQTLMSAG